MPIMFNTVLTEAGFAIADVRLLRHKDNRSAKGRSPYELWRDNRPLFMQYQSTQSLGNASKLKAPYWASFVGTPSDETLFVGMYGVSNQKLLERDTPWPHAEGMDLAGSCHTYDLALDQRLSDLVGILAIEWGLGDRAWVQRPDLQNKKILELRSAFKEPDFSGFSQLHPTLVETHQLTKCMDHCSAGCEGCLPTDVPEDPRAVRWLGHRRGRLLGVMAGLSPDWPRWERRTQEPRSKRLPGLNS